jgi:hypothetical protein
MNSGTELVGNNGFTTMVWGTTMMPATGTMSVRMLKLSFS